MKGKWQPTHRLLYVLRRCLYQAKTRNSPARERDLVDFFLLLASERDLVDLVDFFHLLASERDLVDLVDFFFFFLLLGVPPHEIYRSYRL